MTRAGRGASLCAVADSGMQGEEEAGATKRGRVERAALLGATWGFVRGYLAPTKPAPCALQHRSGEVGAWGRLDVPLFLAEDGGSLLRGAQAAAVALLSARLHLVCLASGSTSSLPRALVVRL